MISYKYECWKCNDWHNGEARNRKELAAISKGLGVEVVASKAPPLLRLTNRGRLLLLRLPFGYGLIIGPRYVTGVYRYKTALWEFADWSEDYTPEVHSILRAGRE